MSIFGGSTDFFGLDIGSKTIRVVRLLGNPPRFSLASFGAVEIPYGLSTSDSTVDQQKLATVIKELVKKTQLDTNNVVIAMPGTSSFSTVIKLPYMSNSELEKAIKFQADQNLPLKSSEAKYDWQVIRQDPQTKELTIMIIAAAQEKVTKLINLMNLADLKVIAIETAAVAMARSLSSVTDPLVMVLDIGAATTEIAIIDQGMLSLTRSFPIAGYAMTRAISQNLNLDPEQAETFKQRFGLSQDKLEGQVYKAVEPVMRNILEEAIRSSKFYQEQTGKDVKRVILTGGSARLPLIAEYIKSFMNVEVSFGNPWSKVSFQSSLNDKIAQMAPEFATAVGLAMRK